METILGIDLGTTNTVVSIIEDNQPRVLELDGHAMVPSVVGFDDDGKLLVGFPARNQMAYAPDRTIGSFKRKMGSDESIQLGDQSYLPHELSAIMLRWIKEKVAQQMGREITKSVITVPAFFTEKQRVATRQAGELAGLDVVRIINEPTAASLTYKSDSEELERLLVYDLGGGTFDVSVVQIEQDVVEVLASHGNTQLGGDDFDELLLDFVCDAFAKEHEVDLRESASTRARVLRAVEEAKKRLSFDAFTKIEEEFIAEKDGLPIHLTMELTRNDYEQLIESLLDKTLVCVDESLSDAKLKVREIDRILLVGGASRTPMVHRLLADRLDKTIHSEVDPDLCVSMGAAIQGGLIDGLELGPVLVDITPHSLGIRSMSSVMGMFESPFVFSRVIDRNTSLPASRSEVFITNIDNQKLVSIEVYQGEHDDVRHNKPVGDFDLEDLSEVPAGNRIVVRFDLDVDGILHVTATEKATGLESDVTIENSLSNENEMEISGSKLEQVFDSPLSEFDKIETDVEITSDSLESREHQPDSDGISRPGQIPEELRPLHQPVLEMIQQAEKLVESANPNDRQELTRLCERLKTAMKKQERSEVIGLLDELGDLVFYVQDA